MSAADEIASVAPVLRQYANVLRMIREILPFQVDTFYGEVVKVADAIGVDIINDVSRGDWDAGMLSAVANTKVPLAYVLSHQRGNPQVMSKNASYPVGSVAKTVGDEIASQYFQKILPSHISGVAMLDRPGSGLQSRRNSAWNCYRIYRRFARRSRRTDAAA